MEGVFSLPGEGLSDGWQDRRTRFARRGVRLRVPPWHSTDPTSVLTSGGMAYVELPPGEISAAETCRTVEKNGLFVSGRGEVRRRQEDREGLVAVEPGVCLAIPLNTHCQFRSFAYDALGAVGVTTPRWPG